MGNAFKSRVLAGAYRNKNGDRFHLEDIALYRTSEQKPGRLIALYHSEEGSPAVVSGMGLREFLRGHVPCEANSNISPMGENVLMVVSNTRTDMAMWKELSDNIDMKKADIRISNIETDTMTIKVSFKDSTLFKSVFIDAKPPNAKNRATFQRLMDENCRLKFIAHVSLDGRWQQLFRFRLPPS